MDFIFDTHAHYNDKAFNEDRTTLLDSFTESGILGVINCGTDIEESENSISLSEKYDFMYCAVGFHPEEISKANENYLEEIRKMANHQKCVAIGEIGLDYYWVKDNKEQQRDLFRKQLSIATRLNLPVVIHSREATQETYDILKEYDLIGIIHCYSGSLEMAKEYIKLGYKIGIGGVVTFKNTNLVEVVKEIDLKDITLETDSPYLAPTPYRGKQNSPEYIPIIAQKIAEIKGIPKEEVGKITTNNIKELFNINI